LVLFSADTGDAWLLDRKDQFAARLARSGAAERVHIEETDTTFTIEWKGSYRLDGSAFVYWDNESEVPVRRPSPPPRVVEHASP
jgi:hypothetical protein